MRSLLCRLGLHFWRTIETYPMADAATVTEKMCNGCSTWRRRVTWRDGRTETRDVVMRAWGVELHGEWNER